MFARFLIPNLFFRICFEHSLPSHRRVSCGVQLWGDKLHSCGVQHEDDRSQPGLIDTYIKSCQLTSLSSELQFSPTLHYHRHLQAAKSD